MPISFDPDVTHDFEAASSREWLEANGLGGFASGTVSGAHTRRYHGLLVAATRPPVGRMVLVSKLAETIAVGGARHEIDTNRYPGTIHPRGFEALESFSLDPFPTFVYRVPGARLRKTVVAVHGENTTIVTYEMLEADGPAVLELRPLIAERDHHALQRANDAIRFADASFRNGIFHARPYDGAPEIEISVPGSTFTAQPDWYRNFVYDRESERGLDSSEDLFCYGVFRRKLDEGETLGVIVSTGPTEGRDAVELAGRQVARRRIVSEIVSGDDETARALAVAADAFVVRRGEDLRTIIAGYPWFSDWGRDTMIALPGICLAMGRHEDAKKILRAYARSVSEGMLPNTFPDAGGTAEYNTVDATLWFFVAASRTLEATSDQEFVLKEILPVLEDIVAWHDRGTRYGIRVDADGLLHAGERGVQLTWMDAKVGDWVVTPRIGKPVEVQALWFNALLVLADLTRRAGRTSDAQGLTERAERVRSAFVEAFWNAEAGCLYDVVEAGSNDASIRPNQIFAISLPHQILPRDKAKSVLAVIEAKLVTPFGLRSLAPDDPSYRGRYEGGPAERDAAYHQGTVWSWLLGPYCDALVRLGGATGKTKARKALLALAPHLREAGLGTISEIFDGDAPHAPRGCPAQAWSVGEALRIYRETTVPAKKKRYKVVAPTTKSSARKSRAKDATA